MRMDTETITIEEYLAKRGINFDS